MAPTIAPIASPATPGIGMPTAAAAPAAAPSFATAGSFGGNTSFSPEPVGIGSGLIDKLRSIGGTIGGIGRQEADIMKLSYEDKRFPQKVDVALAKQDKAVAALRRTVATKESTVYQAEQLLGSMDQRLVKLDDQIKLAAEKGDDISGLNMQHAQMSVNVNAFRTDVDAMKVSRDQFRQQLVQLETKAAMDRDAAAVLKLKHNERVQLKDLPTDVKDAHNRIIDLGASIHRMEQQIAESERKAMGELQQLNKAYVPIGSSTASLGNV